MSSEGGAGYGGDFAGAGGDVLEGAPALGEQGECAFADTAEGPLEPRPAPLYPESARAGIPRAAARQRAAAHGYGLR
jgi:hypothetical protein